MIIYSKKALDENNQDLRKVIAPGTGAFMFKERKEGEKWVFVRNPNYWDRRSPTSTAGDDRTSPRGATGAPRCSPARPTITEWLGGYLARGAQAQGHVGRCGIRASSTPTSAHQQRAKPFNDQRVRRAINLAVSRQNIIKAFGTQEPILLTRWMPTSASSRHP